MIHPRVMMMLDLISVSAHERSHGCTTSIIWDLGRDNILQTEDLRQCLPQCFQTMYIKVELLGLNVHQFSFYFIFLVFLAAKLFTESL